MSNRKLAAASPELKADPPHLHLAAFAMAYPILDGSMTYGEAVSAVMRAAVRERELVDTGDAGMLGVRERLERTISRAIAEVSVEAANAVRRVTRNLIGRRASRAVLQEVAYSVNNQHGAVLPRKCVDWVVVDEVRKALGMPGTAL